MVNEMELKNKIKIELVDAIQEKDKLEKKSWVTCDDKNTKKKWYKVNERIRILKKLLADDLKSTQSELERYSGNTREELDKVCRCGHTKEFHTVKDMYCFELENGKSCGCEKFHEDTQDAPTENQLIILDETNGKSPKGRMLRDKAEKYKIKYVTHINDLLSELKFVGDTKNELDNHFELFNWIVRIYGNRCPDIEKGCACCVAWDLYDRLVQNKNLVQNKVAPEKSNNKLLASMSGLNPYKTYTNPKLENSPKQDLEQKNDNLQGKSTAQNEVVGIVDNLNNERVATLIKKGCGKDLEYPEIKCGDFFTGYQELCSECQEESKNEVNSQCKKDEDLPLENHLDARSKAGEGNLQRNMPVDVDNHADTNPEKSERNPACYCQLPTLENCIEVMKNVGFDIEKDKEGIYWLNVNNECNSQDKLELNSNGGKNG